MSGGGAAQHLECAHQPSFDASQSKSREPLQGPRFFCLFLKAVGGWNPWPFFVSGRIIYSLKFVLMKRKS